MFGNNPTRRDLLSINLIELLVVIVVTGVIAIVINKILENRKGIVSKNKKIKYI